MSRCLPVTSHTRGRWPSRAWRPVAPARPPAQPRRRHERDEHDEGPAGRGPLGGRARRAEAGRPPGVAEALLDGVPVVAGYQRPEGPTASFENEARRPARTVAAAMAPSHESLRLPQAVQTREDADQCPRS